MFRNIGRLLRTPIRIMDGNWGQFALLCFVVFMLLSALLLITRRLHKKTVLPLLMWSVYTALLLMLTIFGRSRVLDPLGSFTKGWDLFSADEEMGLDTIYNLLMFIPWSLLGCMSFSGHKRPLAVAAWFCIFGMFFSVSIEFAQLLSYRGACQLSDVVYNTLSTAIGCLIYLLGAGSRAGLAERQEE